ncbi:MAG: hypothetical protein IJD91_03445 [Clostridia bacterium]|nr:hypothetical protein [Clostridia bacterium]
MFFQHKEKISNADAMREFEKLWNEELLKRGEYRDFSKAYDYAIKNASIREECIKKYFDFESEGSVRYKEACHAFDEGDIYWTFILLRQFSSVPSLNATLKELTNKRRIFLSEDRKESVVARQSVEIFLERIMKASSKKSEEFVKDALLNFDAYNALKEQKKYKSAYKTIVFADKANSYVINLKKHLYYVASRNITEENKEQTKKYFELIKKYFNFKRKTKENELITVDDIDIIIALLTYMKNGGDVSPEDLSKRLHRTVKVYCAENLSSSVCVLADYLHLIGETELEQIALRQLVKSGQSINDKYKKRYTYLELMNENSNKFIFRHNSKIPLECIVRNESVDTLPEIFKKSVKEKDVNSWCLVVKHDVKTYESNCKNFQEDKILSTLETVLDNEFGDYLLEHSVDTYFTGDSSKKAKESMLIITSGRNHYSDFPKLGVMVKIEPITKKIINVHYCVLYLPEEEYTPSLLEEDCKYIEKILNDDTDSRYKTFSTVVEELVWNTVNDLLAK